MWGYRTASSSGESRKRRHTQPGERGNRRLLPFGSTLFCQDEAPGFPIEFDVPCLFKFQPPQTRLPCPSRVELVGAVSGIGSNDGYPTRRRGSGPAPSRRRGLPGDLPAVVREPS